MKAPIGVKGIDVNCNVRSGENHTWVDALPVTVAKKIVKERIPHLIRTQRSTGGWKIKHAERVTYHIIRSLVHTGLFPSMTTGKQLKYDLLKLFETSSSLYALGGLIRYTDPDDKRLKKKIKYVMDNEPFVDGNRPGVLRYAEGAGSRASCCGSHSCYSAAMRALWAVMGIHPEYRSKEVRAFIAKGAAFLVAHNLYQPSHGGRNPIREDWLSLRLPFGLGWQVDLLEILDIARQTELNEHPCMSDGLRILLAKQTEKGRWLLETQSPYGPGRLVSLAKDAEPVGAASKWITLSTLRVLKSCEGLLDNVSDGEESPEKRSQLPRFASYPFRKSKADEMRVREQWAEFDMTKALASLLGFAGKRKLKIGWHWGSQRTTLHPVIVQAV